ncbi:MAG: 3-deoxy-7-phosphoheptulonate synthase [Planctomycetota bacterium]
MAAGTSLILVLEPGTPATRRNRIRSRLVDFGVEVRVASGGDHEYLEVTGEHYPILTLSPGSWEGVARVISVAPDYPHAAARPDRSKTVVTVGGGDSDPVRFGADFAVIGGPCAIEDEERGLRLAAEVQRAGAVVYRGGAFKPRTSPYAFQGLQERGLEILVQAREQTRLPIVTEVMDVADIGKVAEAADLLQVGSRNMQNYSLLKQLAQLRKPVLLKRGYAATIRELLLAAEYLLSGGNDQVILCERGIRSAAGEGGVILDLGAVPELQRRTHLPVIVDPSHGSSNRERVLPLARAATAVGADGLLVEVHDDPQSALSDGQQALRVDEFAQLVTQVAAVRRAIE